MVFFEEGGFIPYGVPQNQVRSDVQYVIPKMGLGEDALPGVVVGAPLLALDFQLGGEAPFGGPFRPTVGCCFTLLLRFDTGQLG